MERKIVAKKGSKVRHYQKDIIAFVLMFVLVCLSTIELNSMVSQDHVIAEISRFNPWVALNASVLNWTAILLMFSAVILIPVVLKYKDDGSGLYIPNKVGNRVIYLSHFSLVFLGFLALSYLMFVSFIVLSTNNIKP